MALGHKEGTMIPFLVEKSFKCATAFTGVIVIPWIGSFPHKLLTIFPPTHVVSIKLVKTDNNSYNKDRDLLVLLGCTNLKQVFKE